MYIFYYNQLCIYQINIPPLFVPAVIDEMQPMAQSRRNKQFSQKARQIHIFSDKTHQ